ncbi:hypothetical protein SKC41_30770 [Mycobacterium sp. 050128]
MSRHPPTIGVDACAFDTWDAVTPLVSWPAWVGDVDATAGAALVI